MNLLDQVKAFHIRYGHLIGRHAAVPSDETMRMRLALIAEEFFELMSAAEATPIQIGARHVLEDGFASWLCYHHDVDLPDFVDALGDLLYVIMGTFVVLGVDPEPILAEIHRANMTKIPNGLNKPTKPEDWTPPDIEGELRRQGWST